MEDKPKLKVDLKEKKLHFNGNYIKLDETLHKTEIFYFNKEREEKGMKLVYNDEDILTLNREYIKINKFIQNNGLEKALQIRAYGFPERSILIYRMK